MVGRAGWMISGALSVHFLPGWVGDVDGGACLRIIYLKLRGTNAVARMVDVVRYVEASSGRVREYHREVDEGWCCLDRMGPNGGGGGGGGEGWWGFEQLIL